MSRQPKNKEAEPAEFPEGTEIEAGANYDVYDPLQIVDRDPDKYYYFAADDGDKIRPDGVYRLTREKGYVRSEKEHGSPDCVLLEKPLKDWEAEQAARAKRDAKAQRDSMEAPTGLQRLGRGNEHGIGR